MNFIILYIYIFYIFYFIYNIFYCIIYLYYILYFYIFIILLYVWHYCITRDYAFSNTAPQGFPKDIYKETIFLSVDTTFQYKTYAIFNRNKRYSLILKCIAYI